MSATRKPLVEIHAVDQIFRAGFWLKPVQVLHHVQIQVPEKSVFGFLGANGAGKTTLIQLLVGLRAPTRGTVKVGGHLATTAKARRKIGYLPERPYFYDHLTGEDFLKYFGTLSGMTRNQLLDRIPTVLSTVGMTAAKNVELRRYSKGMLQRIGIAQAILHEPELLVLDEPMSGLDPIGRKEIRELILSLSQEGRTVFFSSHVIPDVEAICDEVALIDQGRILQSGPIGGLLSKGPIQTEIAFSGVTAANAKKIEELMRIQEMPDGIRAIVTSQVSANDALSSLIKKGARILWVSPIRPSLEDFFKSTKEGGSA
ncbi:MAG: ABC transporter ATP-binding protein [Bdellovibrionales bacterium]|nr:ABC transporter ATP-binding protein [Bdellovibrionales bacterium]